MKASKTGLLIPLMVLCGLAKAQIMLIDSYKNINMTTLYIPKTGDAFIDSSIAASFKTYWKVTPFEFISGKEYHDQVNPKEGPSYTNGHSNYFNLCNIYSMGCLLPLSLLHDENLPGEQNLDGTDYYSKTVGPPKGMYHKYAYKIMERMDYMVKGANDAIQFSIDNKIIAPKREYHAKASWVFNSQAYKLKDKTLIINGETRTNMGIKVFKESVFEKDYPYKYKFVSAEEYKAILKGNNPDYVCMKIVSDPAIPMIMVYEPATRSTVYYDYTPRPGGFDRYKDNNLEDLIKMVKLSASLKATQK